MPSIYAPIRYNTRRGYLHQHREEITEEFAIDLRHLNMMTTSSCHLIPPKKWKKASWFTETYRSREHKKYWGLRNWRHSYWRSKLNYLGNILSPDDGAVADITSQIAKAQGAFSSIWPIWKSSQLSRYFNTFRIHQVDSHIRQWDLARAQLRHGQVFINKCVRIICKVFYHNRIRIDDLWIRSGEDSKQKQFKRKEWRFVENSGEQIAQRDCSRLVATRKQKYWTPETNLKKDNRRRYSRLRKELERNLTYDN